jgi:glutathione S-transferase
VKLYDAARCPYCARVRIVLAEKGIEYDTVEIDLRDRPDWIYDLNPSGKVPVLDDEFVLPESEVIMEYLEEKHPQPPLLPTDPRGARGGEAPRPPVRRALGTRLLRVPAR